MAGENPSSESGRKLILETDRLILRRWLDADIEPLAQMNADPRVMEFLRMPPMTRQESEDLLHRLENNFDKNGFGFWAMQSKKNKEFIGYTGLNIPGFRASFTPCVEVGWRIACEHWGKGYATEGAKAALEFGFRQIRLDEILSWTYEGNARSIRVMQKLGMVSDPRDDFHHPSLPQGHRLSKHVLYRITNPYKE